MGTLLDKPNVEKETEVKTQDESAAKCGNGEGLAFGASAMQGWRMEMEDSHTIVPNIPDLPDHSFVAVYDGHGGSLCAKVAGQRVLKQVGETKAYQEYVSGGCKDVSQLEQALVQGFLRMDEELRLEPDLVSGQDRSGCTAVASIITPSHVVLAHAGDSRAVFVSKGVVKARTDDHKPTDTGERTRIEAAGGCVSMKRVDGDLAVSRALGDFQYKDHNIKPEACKVTAYPDTQSCARVRAEDALLVIACDGIWDVMTDEECVSCLQLMMGEGEQHLGLMCEELLDTCLAKGSRDNMSAVLVRFPACEVASEGEGIAGRRRMREEARKLEGGEDGAVEEGGETRPEQG